MSVIRSTDYVPSSATSPPAWPLTCKNLPSYLSNSASTASLLLSSARELETSVNKIRMSAAVKISMILMVVSKVFSRDEEVETVSRHIACR